MSKKSGFAIIAIVLLFGTIAGVFMAFGVSKWEVYCKALDALMNEDIGLNDGIEYIAVDIDSMEGIKKKDNAKVLEYFEKYNVEVVNESFETLREKGMVKDGNAIDGLLLRVDKSNTFIAVLSFERSKFRTGTGAIGGHATAIGIWGKWIMISSRTTWIS